MATLEPARLSRTGAIGCGRDTNSRAGGVAEGRNALEGIAEELEEDRKRCARSLLW